MATVSVCIPTFNRGAKIQATLDSVLAQTLVPLEITVIDDGSDDGTPDWIEAQYGKRVQVVRQRNQGVASARNQGLELARGDYIAFLDHDDLWLPTKLEKQMATANSHPDAALISCLWRDVDENGNNWQDAIWHQIYRNWKPARGDVYDWVCASPCPIVSMTLPLIQTEKLRAVGGFDPKMVPCDDWDIYLKLAHRFPFDFVDEELACYVHHQNQQSGAVAPLHAATLRVLKRQFPAIISHRRSWGFWWSFSRVMATSPAYTLAKSNLEKGKRGAVARQLLFVALRHPFAFVTKQWIYLTLRFLRGQTAPF